MSSLKRPGPLLRLSGGLFVALVLLSVAGSVDGALAASGPSFAAHNVTSIDEQTDEGASSDGDTKVPVQVWTIFASGGAAAILLLLYMVRVGLGRVPAPPSPQEDAHH